MPIGYRDCFFHRNGWNGRRSTNPEFRKLLIAIQMTLTQLPTKDRESSKKIKKGQENKDERLSESSIKILFYGPKTRCSQLSFQPHFPCMKE